MRLRRPTFPVPLILAAVCGPLLIAGCASDTTAPTSAGGASAEPSTWLRYDTKPSVDSLDPDQLAPGEAAPPSLVASGTLLPYRPGATAITYDPTVVPAGARARVVVTMTSYGLVVRLTAAGLIPRRAYGAHLHTQPCTADANQAGPHYEHDHAPSTPAVDPSYANPSNEVWLDFVADATGAGTAVSEQDWRFDPAAPPRSLVLHAQPTRTEPGVAGTAGARVACLTLPAG